MGGGIGWLMRKHGLTVDNLVEAEVVTADGDIIRASAQDHPDLFWALRGGGGTSASSAPSGSLHPVGPTVMAGPVFWTAGDTSDVLRFIANPHRRARRARHRRSARHGPSLSAISEELHFRPAIAVVSCAGPVEDGRSPSVRPRVLEAARGSGRTTLYVDHQSGIDDTVPHGWRYYWKGTDLNGLSDEVIDIVAERAYRATSPRSYAAMFHLGGAVARACAMPPRIPVDVHHRMSIDAAWLPSRTTRSAPPRWRGRRSSSTPSNPTVRAST